ncbi:hypothetical protein [Brevundimonas viscosa]|uniref:hypothetical protein n=1 Tax=Brevundimonas viscosa TaxID=871741 RepID=UPI00116061D3|nr:hypothetical protein [Brevundimonas viscosa]
MAGSILIVGYNASRTPKMIDELCAEKSPGQTLVLLTRQSLTDPDPRVRYVQTENLTSPAALRRAGAPTASRILIYAATDADTLAATLAAAATAEPAAHIVCFFEEADNARLLAQHCPRVEVVVASGAEMLVRAAADPGASHVISALTSRLDEGATLFCLAWAGEPAPVDDVARRLWSSKATLLALQSMTADEPRFNPPSDLAITRGDRLFYVARSRLDPHLLAA